MARKPKTNPKGDKPHGGRKTKYKSTYPNKMIKWFEMMSKEKGEMMGKTYIPPKLPTFERFAVFEVDVCVDTLLEWTLHYPLFSEAYVKCKNIQKEHLNQYALNGMYNGNYSKFVAMNITDMREKVETEIKSDKPILNINM